MSGLFGIVGHKNQPLKEMAARLAHRGTDVHEKIISDTVAIGCIQGRGKPGLETYQHLYTVGDHWIANARELTSTMGMGTDADLLTAAYAKTGKTCFDNINGQYSFAAWDTENQELVLARDFTGTLPLYYVSLPDGGLAFASEQKSLLAIDTLPAKPDLDMVQRLQNYKHLPSERNLLQAIKAVPPGTAIGFDAIGKEKWRHSQPGLQLNIKPLSLDQALKKVSQTFMDAISARVAGLKTIGIALSGGIDSIGVACACRQANPEAQIYTFSAGHGPEDPEIKTAEFVANHLGTHHHSVYVTPDDIAANIKPLVWHLENPIARTESLQFFKLAGEAGKHVDNLFTGAAADGLFAGMPKHKILWLMRLLPLLRMPLGEFYHLTQSGDKPESLLGKLMDKIYFRGKVPEVPNIIGGQFKPDKPTFPGHSSEFVNDFLCRAFQEGVAQWLPKVERTLRAFGITYTSPFLDKQVMDMAFTIPSRYKIYRGKEKYVLRQALRQMVPPEVLQIPKFPMKMKHDAAFSDTLDAVADEWLSKERVTNRGFFQYEQIQKLRRRQPGQSYSSEGAMRIWTAVLTECWAELFLDGRGEKISS